MAASKRARKTRQASEFDLARLTSAIRAPRTPAGVYSWSLEQIVEARNEQMRGRFRLARRAAESMRTDDAIYVARAYRLAPQESLKIGLTPAKGAKVGILGEAEALYGNEGVAVTIDTRRDIHDALVEHGVAFGSLDAQMREDGSRVDLYLRSWPIEHVRWDEAERTFKTQTDGGAEETITHGDGRWVVFQVGEHEPFKNGALLASLLVWARHAFALRDWAKGSVAHGSAKVVGELPQGLALQDENGLTSEAAAFIELLRAIASDDSPVGIRPHGSTTDFLANNSTAWQVWKELVLNAEKAAARIYLGTDGILGSQGGAPGVDIESLFGVASTFVEKDLTCIQRGINTGVIQPWCAINFGSSKHAPTWAYKVPDADEDARAKSYGERRQALHRDIRSMRDNGYVLTQEDVDAIAAKYGVDAPLLPEESEKAPTIELAPTDIARVVSVNEARASAGLGPLMGSDGQFDPDGKLTVEEYSAKKKQAFAVDADAVGDVA